LNGLSFNRRAFRQQSRQPAAVAPLAAAQTLLSARRYRDRAHAAMAAGGQSACHPS
jgi:hypothetical protein